MTIRSDERIRENYKGTDLDDVARKGGTESPEILTAPVAIDLMTALKKSLDSLNNKEKK